MKPKSNRDYQPGELIEQLNHCSSSVSTLGYLWISLGLGAMALLHLFQLLSTDKAELGIQILIFTLLAFPFVRTLILSKKFWSHSDRLPALAGIVTLLVVGLVLLFRSR